MQTPHLSESALLLLPTVDVVDAAAVVAAGAAAQLEGLDSLCNTIHRTESAQ